MSKVFERVLFDQIEEFFKDKFSMYLCGFRKGYSTQYALTHLLYKWQKCLDESGVVGTLLMDLSKAYDCLPHDLIIAKLEAYGFDTKSLKLIFSYLTNRKQRVKIGSRFSKWLAILLGVPQGSILGPILFNIFINDLFMFLKETDICNFADDNTIFACDKDIEVVISRLKNDIKRVIDWYNANSMVANPDKFQLMFLGKKVKDPINLSVNNISIKSVDSVKLLGVEIDNKLNFVEHIKNICKKANNKTNALLRIRKYIDAPTARIYANAYVLSAFSYCPLIWMFCNRTSENLINKAHRRCLKCVYNTNMSLEGLTLMDNSVPIHKKNLRILMIEVYKSLNQINPDFMWDLVQYKNSPYQLRMPQILTLPTTLSKTYGTYSLAFRESFVWNNLPAKLKDAATLQQFRKLIHMWQGNICNCKLCS